MVDISIKCWCQLIICLYTDDLYTFIYLAIEHNSSNLALATGDTNVYIKSSSSDTQSQLLLIIYADGAASLHFVYMKSTEQSAVTHVFHIRLYAYMVGSIIFRDTFCAHIYIHHKRPTAIFRMQVRGYWKCSLRSAAVTLSIRTVYTVYALCRRKLEWSRAKWKRMCVCVCDQCKIGWIVRAGRDWDTQKARRWCGAAERRDLVAPFMANLSMGR